MTVGYLYTVMALGSFGLLGILNKVAEVKKCRPSAVSASLCLWSAAMVFAYLRFSRHSGPGAPRNVIVVATVFGITGAIASISFLAGLKYGKISTSWLIINLSSAGPAVASILLYGESVTLRKGTGLAVAAAALFLLYKDKVAEESDRVNRSTGKSENGPTKSRASKDKRLWLQLMFVAFLTNGLGAFGLKILAEKHLSGQYQFQYLFFWYLASSIISALAFLTKHSKPLKREIVMGAGMGLCSLLGQLGMVLAMSSRVPGYLVFPLAIGGNLFIVVAGGLILFKERLRAYGFVGLGLGVAALVILAVP
jgi:drug/metabolite transporter (DMT)-like permease